MKLKRINLIAGKGGVGRSTLSYSLACETAAEGKNTLLLEIEDDSRFSSPLARRFNLDEFPLEPKEVFPHLKVMRLSSSYGQKHFLKSVLKIESLVNSIVSNAQIKWFLEGAPSFKEMGIFYHLLLEMRKPYDCIILDLPATGHFLGLTRLPSILLKMIPLGPIADRIREGQSYLYNQNEAGVFIVTLPEPMPISEALELRSALKQEPLAFSGFILNRTPFNPFTEAEEKRLEALCLKHEPSRILTELKRIKLYRDCARTLGNALEEEGLKRELVQCKELTRAEMNEARAESRIEVVPC